MRRRRQVICKNAIFSAAGGYFSNKTLKITGTFWLKLRKWRSSQMAPRSFPLKIYTRIQQNQGEMEDGMVGHKVWCRDI